MLNYSFFFKYYSKFVQWDYGIPKWNKLWGVRGCWGGESVRKDDVGIVYVYFVVLQRFVITERQTKKKCSKN